MKKVLLFLLASLSIGLGIARSDDTQAQIIGPFGTLNNTDNPLVIPPEMAQDLLNVDIAPGGKSVRKRDGYSLAFELPITTSPVHGTYAFYDGTGRHIALAFSDRYMSASIDGSTMTTVMSTGTFGATYQCVDSQGFAYCVNSATGTILKTNGVTFSTITPTQNGTILTVTPERLALAGFQANPNRVDFSKANDFTTWTVGGQPTDPVTFNITSAGSRITHLTYAHKRVYYFKDESFGFILDGPSLGDWRVVTVSPRIGTLDNSSVYWEDDILYFRGQDGHMYAYDGGDLVQMSRDIQTTVNLSQRRRLVSVTETSQADWGAGSSSVSGVYIDTVTTPGRIQMTFPESWSTFRDGSSGTKNVWARYNAISSTGSVSVSGSSVTIQNNGGTSGRVTFRTTEPLADFRRGTTYQFTIHSLTLDATKGTSFFMVLRSSVVAAGNPETSAAFALTIVSTTSGKFTLSNLAIAGRSGSAATTGDYAMDSAVQVYLTTTTYQISVAGSVALSGTHTESSAQTSYLYYGLARPTASTATVNFSGLLIAPLEANHRITIDTGISDPTWELFTAASTLNGGLIDYTAETCTPDPVSGVCIYGSAVPIVSGNVISVSSAQRIRVTTRLRILSTANTPPTLEEYTVNWLVGQSADKSYQTYFDDAIWFSVSKGTASSSSRNNTIIVWDMENKGFTLYDIGANGFFTRNNVLYFGSSSEGKVFRFGGVANDAGSAINAYWKSKEFIGQTPFVDNDYLSLSISALSVANSSMTATFSVNGSSESAYTAAMYTPRSAFTKNNRNFPAGVTGSTFSLKFGNNAQDQPFEVYGCLVGYRPKSWKVTP